STKPGEQAKKKAEELMAKRQEVLSVAQAVNNRLTPPAGPSIELPKGPFDTRLGPLGPAPKAPDTIPPPTGTPPPAAPAPKAPDAKAPATTPPPAPTPPPSTPTP